MRVFAVTLVLVVALATLSLEQNLALALGVIERVSVSNTGAIGNSHSSQPSISADGRYVAFASNANNLVFNDRNGVTDVFVHDRQARTTELVSISSTGVQGNALSSEPSISADGRFVAFVSYASNLVPGDINSSSDIFVRDRQTGTTELISKSVAGGTGNSLSWNLSMSPDGRYVAFVSYAGNLVAGDTNNRSDMFIRDRQTGNTQMLPYFGGTNPSISADGRYLSFVTYDSLVPLDGNGSRDVYIYDRLVGTVELVGATSGGASGSGESTHPSMSPDGRFIVFLSSAGNLVPGDTNGRLDVFVRDRLEGKTELVSVNNTGIPGNGDSDEFPPGGDPRWISADGRYVVFWSSASNLVAGDTNGVRDVFIRDRVARTTERLSLSSRNTEVYLDSITPAISRDGRYVAFASLAVDMVTPFDPNWAMDIFVREMSTPDTAPPTTTAGGAPRGWTKNDPVTIALNATDDQSGVGGTYYTLDNGSQQAGTSVVVYGEGTHTLKYWSVDKAGNSEGQNTVEIKMDKTVPSISGAPTTSANSYGWYNADVTVHFTASDMGSGIDTVSADTIISTEGANQSVKGTATDKAGNSNSATVEGINLDKTAPTLTGAASTETNETGWYKGDVMIRWTATDVPTGSGIDPAAAPRDSVISGEGRGLTASASVQDKAGNQINTTSASVNVDRTPPITSATVPPGWQNSDVSVSLSASDGLSGVKATYFRVNDAAPKSGTGVVSTEGENTIQYWSEDIAGNVESPRAAQVKIDKTAPSIVGTPDRSANAFGWYDAEVTVSFTCDDPLSNIESCSGPTTLSEGVGQSVTGYATDKAGNKASATVADIDVDRTPPTVSYSGNAGSYTVDESVSISCVASDVLSGVQATTCQDVSGPAYSFLLGNNSYLAIVVDKAGNIGSGSTRFSVAVTYDSLSRLTSRFVTNTGIANALNAKLEAAAAAAARGDLRAKEGQINAYRNQLAAQSGKAIMAASAPVLIGLADGLQ